MTTLSLCDTEGWTRASSCMVVEPPQQARPSPSTAFHHSHAHEAPGLIQQPAVPFLVTAVLKALPLGDHHSSWRGTLLRVASPGPTYSKPRYSATCCRDRNLPSKGSTPFWVGEGQGHFG